MKVLMGIDGSPGAAEAVRQAGKLLSTEDEIGLYFSPPEFRAPAGSSISGHVLSQARQSLTSSVFQEAVQELPADLRRHVVELTGSRDPRQGLLVAAAEWQADLLVVGARGLNAVSRWFLGSVSDSVALHAPVPVLVVRPRGERSGLPWKVLLATDGSPTAGHAAQLVSRLSWPSGTTGQVMTVMESMLGGELPDWLEKEARSNSWEPLAEAWFREHESIKEQKVQQMGQFCLQLPAPFHGQAPMVCEGHPAEKILEQISQNHVDLVVLGARRLGPIQRWLGSTSLPILHHAPCSVLLVREHETA